MISYLEQLKEKARTRGVFLHHAFKVAKVNQTTYSRSMRQLNCLHYRTALKVAAAIEKIYQERLPPPKTPKGAGRFRVVSV